MLHWSSIITRCRRSRIQISPQDQWLALAGVPPNNGITLALEITDGRKICITNHSTAASSRAQAKVAQDSLDAGQALIDSSMVHINLEAAKKSVISLKR